MRHVHRHLSRGCATSGDIAIKTRPWEMKHVGTICTHCGDRAARRRWAYGAPIQGCKLFAAIIATRTWDERRFSLHQGPLSFDFANMKIA